MAKSGKRSEVGAAAERSTGTRQALVSASIATLKDVGFAGASAREIARRSGCNQALIFYHYGSVANLLLAALDEVSDQRRALYQPLVTGGASMSELVAAGARIFRQDLEGGHMKVLAEMIAATSVTPGLDAQVVKRIAPWREFAADAVRGAIANTPLGQAIDADAVAHAIVALYLGLEMLAQLDGDSAPGQTLFDQAATLATLASSFIQGGME